MTALRVAFAGTPEFAAAALRQIHGAGFEVPLVLTQPDRPAGRGLKLQASVVKLLALAHGLPVVQPRSLRLDGKSPDDAAAARDALQAARPDVLVVAAYGLILPREVLVLPRLGCLNIHASLLPRWRGAAPIQRAIEAGDARSGITIMQMDEGLDTGDMLLAEALDLRPEDTAATLHERLAALGSRLVVDALRAVSRGGLQRIAQPLEGVTYAHKIDKSEGLIDWRLDAATIERRVRAFDPFPGASFVRDGQQLKVWRAQALSIDPAHADPAGKPGDVIALGNDAVRIACGGGTALDLVELQRPGGRRVPATSLAQALGLRAGEALASPPP